MGGRDGTVVVWDICTGEAKQELCAALSIALTGSMTGFRLGLSY